MHSASTRCIGGFATLTAMSTRQLLGVFVSTCFVALFLLLPGAEVYAGPGGFVPCEGTECSACDLVTLIQRLLVWLIGIIFVIFAVLLAVAGFGLVTSGGNQTALSDAKSKFTNALIGIVIVLAAWLMVDTLMRAILPGDTGTISGWGPWMEVQCFEQTEAIPYVREGADAPDPVSGDVTDPASVEGTLGHSEAAQQLADEGIQIKASGECSDKSNPTCTSLEGARPRTVERTIELADAVGSENVVVTGFTETGHSRNGNYRHDNGYKVDLRTTPALNQHIEDNFQSIGGNKWRDPDGNIYYRHEPDHWDVTVTN